MALRIPSNAGIFIRISRTAAHWLRLNHPVLTAFAKSAFVLAMLCSSGGEGGGGYIP
jgi:hypothetical protein